MPLSRRQIIRACKQRGWTLQPAAFEGLEEYLDEEERNNSAMTDLQSILEIVAEKIGGGRTLTAEVWSQVIEVLDGKDAEVSFKAQRDISDVSSGLEVVGAFQTPRLIYDTLRKQFDVDEKPRSLFGSVEDKVRYVPLFLFETKSAGVLQSYSTNTTIALLHPDEHACSEICTRAPAGFETQALSSKQLASWAQ